MLLNKALLVSFFAALAIGQTSIDAPSSVTPSPTKHAKHSAVRSVTHFPAISKNGTVKTSSGSIHVTTVTETVALSLVLDILDISVRVASHASSASKGKSSEVRNSSRRESSCSTWHGCSVTTTPQQTCGGPGATTTATVTSTVSQGFILGMTSTARSSTSSTPSILSATSSSG